MADNTPIEWCDATWNPITGCSVTSPGCTNCYAMKLAGTRLAQHPSRAGLTHDTKAGPVWTGEVRFNEQWLDQPLRWRRPRKIFVCAHGDLFHGSVPDAWIDRVFAVMALAPQHTFQVLTKRSARMREYLADEKRWFAIWMGMCKLAENSHPEFQGCAKPVLPLPNVWLGVSVEDQARADERIPDLLATPAAVRFISAEPLLGPVNIEPWLNPDAFCQGCDDGEGYGNRCSSDAIPRDEQCPWKRAIQHTVEHGPFSHDGEPSAITCDVIKLDWVIAGGENGPRPMHPDWARSLRDQAAAAGVPFLFKHWGEWEVAIDRDRDDPDWRADYSNTYVDHGQTKWLNLKGGCGFHGERFVVMRRVGKKRAGRLLDGVEHNGFPEVHHG